MEMAKSGTRDPNVGISHEAIQRGVAAVNAFEIAICLFTGRVTLLEAVQKRPRS